MKKQNNQDIQGRNGLRTDQQILDKHTGVQEKVRGYMKRGKLRRIIAILSAFVLLLTVNSLKFRADTLQRIAMCGLEEHTHTEACYNEAGELVCGRTEHTHTDACYQQRPVKPEPTVLDEFMDLNSQVVLATPGEDGNISSDSVDQTVGETTLDLDADGDAEVVGDEAGSADSGQEVELDLDDLYGESGDETLTSDENVENADADADSDADGAADADETTAEYSLNGGSVAFVSDILKATGLEAAGIIAVGEIVDDTFVEEHIAIEPVEGVDDEYILKVTESFDRVLLGMATADAIETVWLTEGQAVVAVPDEAQTSDEEAVTETPAEPSEEIVEQDQETLNSNETTETEQKQTEVGEIETKVGTDSEVSGDQGASSDEENGVEAEAAPTENDESVTEDASDAQSVEDAADAQSVDDAQSAEDAADAQNVDDAQSAEDADDGAQADETDAVAEDIASAGNEEIAEEAAGSAVDGDDASEDETTEQAAEDGTTEQAAEDDTTEQAAADRTVSLDFTNYIVEDAHTVYLYDAEMRAVLVNAAEIESVDGVVVTADEDEAADEEAPGEEGEQGEEAATAEAGVLVIEGDGEYVLDGTAYVVTGLVLPEAAVEEAQGEEQVGDEAQDEEAPADDAQTDDGAVVEDQGADDAQAGAAEKTVALDFTDYVATDDHAVYLYDASMVAVLVSEAEIASVDGVTVTLPEDEAAEETGEEEAAEEPGEEAAEETAAEESAAEQAVLVITGDGEYILNGTAYVVAGLTLPEKTVGSDNITITTTNDEATLLNVAPVFEETDEDYDDIFSLFTMAKDDPTLLARVMDVLGGVAYAEEGEGERDLNVKVFKIGLEDVTTGEAVEPGTELHVETSLDAPVVGEKFQLYHIEDGKAELIPDAVVVEDGRAVGLNFNTVSLDKFALVYYTVKVAVDESAITVSVDFTDVVANGVDFDAQTILTALNDGVAINVASLLAGETGDSLIVEASETANVNAESLEATAAEGGVTYADGEIKVTGDGSVTLTDSVYTVIINVTNYQTLVEKQLSADGVSVTVLEGDVPAGSTVSYEALSADATDALVKEYKEYIGTAEQDADAAGQAADGAEQAADGPEQAADGAEQAADAANEADATGAADQNKEEETGSVTGYTAFDVSVTMPEGDAFKDGGEFAVTVEHEVDAASLVPEGAVIDSITYELFHIHEGEAKAIDDVTVADGQVSFTTDGFSEYVIRYTVDFHYNGVDYSIPGNTQILLTQLIDIMHITAPDGDEDPDNEALLDIHEVASVEFTDAHLVQVDQVSGLVTINGTDGERADVDAGDYNFLLSSLEPFSTNEKLTITLKDGTVIEVGVTDAQDKLEVKVSAYDYDDATTISIPSDIADDNIFIVVWVGDNNIISDAADDTPWQAINASEIKGTASPKTFDITSFNTSPYGGGNNLNYSNLTDDQKAKIRARLIHTSEGNITLGWLKNIAQYQSNVYAKVWNGGFNGYDMSSEHPSRMDASTGVYEINLKKGNTKEQDLVFTFDPATDADSVPTGYHVIFDAQKTDGSHIYYVQPVVIDGNESKVYIPLEGLWGNNERADSFSENWIVTPTLVKGSLTAGGQNDHPQPSQYTVAATLGEYHFTYEGYAKETDSVNHVEHQTFTYKLEKIDINHDYDYADILGPGVYYGIAVDTFYNTGHIQTNIAVNNYYGKDGEINPNLASTEDGVRATGVIAAAHIKDERMYLNIGANDGKALVFVDPDDEQYVTDSGGNTLNGVYYFTIPTEGSQISASIVDPILNHGSAMSSILMSKEITFTPVPTDNGTIDLTMFPAGVTFYFDGDLFKDKIAASQGLKFIMNSDQVVVFNYDSTEDITINKTMMTVNGENKNEEYIAEHVVYNCASASTVHLVGTYGMFLIPRDDAQIWIENSSEGWVISNGTLNQRDYGCEWHLKSKKMKKDTTASTHFGKRVDGVSPKHNEVFNFPLYKWDENAQGSHTDANWSLVATLNNAGPSMTYDVKMGEGRIFKIVESGKASTTSGEYVYDTNEYYVLIRYVSQAVGLTTEEIAAYPEYYPTFDAAYDVYLHGAGASAEHINSKLEGIVFNNETVKGGLNITKEVIGTDERDKNFTFELDVWNHEADDETDPEHPTYAYTGEISGTKGGAAWTASDGDKSKGTFTEGVNTYDTTKVTFTLKAGETLNINSLPVGTHYAIKELTGDEMPAGYAYIKATKTQGETTTTVTAPVNTISGTIPKDSEGSVTVTYTNTYTPKTGSLIVKKSFATGSETSGENEIFTFEVDFKNADGTAFAGKVKVTDHTRTDAEVTAVGGKVTLTVQGAGSATITEIPAGTKYTVTETNLPTGWAQKGVISCTSNLGSADHSIAPEETETATVTNQEVVDIEATKLWKYSDDTNITATILNASVTLQLMQSTDEGTNWENVGEAKTISTTDTVLNEWKADWKNLPKYKDGKIIQYKVVETAATIGEDNVLVTPAPFAVVVNKDSDYQTISESNPRATGVIENTLPDTSIIVKKVWKVGDNEIVWPNGLVVTVGLYQKVGTKDPVEVTRTASSAGSGAKPEQVTVTLNSGNAGEEPEKVAERTFANLPVYDEQGNKITYSVKETKVNSTSVTEAVVGSDVVRTVTLTTGEKSTVWTVTDGGVSEGKATITNQRQPDKTNIKVLKDWKDADGKTTRTAPENVTISYKIYKTASKDGMAIDEGYPEEVELTSSKGRLPVIEDSVKKWEDTITDLPLERVDTADNKIINFSYYVVEAAAEDDLYPEQKVVTYQDNDGTWTFNIINRLTDADVTKVWKTYDLNDLELTEDVTVKLILNRYMYCNNKRVAGKEDVPYKTIKMAYTKDDDKVTVSEIVGENETVLQTRALTDNDPWKYVYQNLPAEVFIDDDNNAETPKVKAEYRYAWDEEDVPEGYTRALDEQGTIVPEAKKSQTITNVYNPSISLPSTGGPGTTMFYVIGSILTLLAAVLLITKKRTDGQGID